MITTRRLVTLLAALAFLVAAVLGTRADEARALGVLSSAAQPPHPQPGTISPDTATVHDLSPDATPSTVALTTITFISGGKITDIAHAGDGRLFIVDQPGRIYIVDEGGTRLTTPFLDISGPVDDSGNEKGLLGLVFHPDYASNGYFFVNYTHSLSGGLTTRISRFQVSSGDPNVANAASELVILEVSQTDSNHNGGALHFDSDGMLVIASGDGGGANDPPENAQNTSVLLGKMLRIDVDSAAGAGPDCDISGNSNYRIPADNPLADGPNGVCDEIWAVGMRNPWRFSFDRLTGATWIGDVGQGAREEINYEPPGFVGGRNYGWDCYEGTLTNATDPSPLCDTGDPSDYTPPVYEYGHTSGRCSITGGYVYRGPSHEGLLGHYLYADYCTRELWTLSGDPAAPTVVALALAPGSSLGNPRTFGEDAAGEHYVASSTTVYRIDDPDAPPVAPVVSIATGANNSVLLAWDDDPANCSYDVVESTSPYFDPAGATLLQEGVTGTGEISVSIDNATGDPAVNHVYVTRAVNCSGLSLADSAEVAEFDFSLQPGD